MASRPAAWIPAYPGSNAAHYPGVGSPHYPSTGLAPPTSLLWHDGQDINLLANVGIADADPIGTWKNKGSLGAVGDLVQATALARPLFRLIATPGKINNLSALEGDAARFMSTGALGPLSQPLIIGLVFRPTDLATYVWHSGSAAPGQCEMYTTAAGPGGVSFTAGTDRVTGLLVAATTWKTWVGTFNGATSFGRLDGAQSANLDPGAGGLSGYTLFAEGAVGGFKAKGMIAESVVCVAGAGVVAQLEAYFAAKYGATPH